MNREEMMLAASCSAAVVKLVCGVGNNAAWVVMMEGYDHAKRCKGIRRGVKGGHMVGWYFKRAINDFNDYERHLLRAQENRMFHLADMSEDVRRKYGDISDDEYYEFWKGVGAVAYGKTKPMVTSLWNKYRVSLLSHDVKDAEHVAWVMTTQAALDLAVVLYKKSIEECRNSYGLNESLLTSIFGQFNLQTISDDWRRAMLLLEPQIESITLDDTEDKNIQHGLRQLLEAWTDPELLYSSTSGAVEDYEEIFSTQGFKKKVLREIAEVKSETLAELEKE